MTSIIPFLAALPKMLSCRTAFMVSGNRVIISILMVDITNLHSFYQSHGHDRIFRIDPDDELVHRRDKVLGLALDDIYL